MCATCAQEILTWSSTDRVLPMLARGVCKRCRSRLDSERSLVARKWTSMLQVQAQLAAQQQPPNDEEVARLVQDIKSLATSFWICNLESR